MNPPYNPSWLWSRYSQLEKLPPYMDTGHVPLQGMGINGPIARPTAMLRAKFWLEKASHLRVKKSIFSTGTWHSKELEANALPSSAFIIRRCFTVSSYSLRSHLRHRIRLYRKHGRCRRVILLEIIENGYPRPGGAMYLLKGAFQPAARWFLVQARLSCRCSGDQVRRCG